MALFHERISNFMEEKRTHVVIIVMTKFFLMHFEYVKKCHTVRN